MAASSGLFEPVLAALDANGVRSVVVGGVATVLHGHARLTADLDLDIEALELIRTRGERS